jgi:hypothetical protein
MVSEVEEAEADDDEEMVEDSQDQYSLEELMQTEAEALAAELDAAAEEGLDLARDRRLCGDGSGSTSHYAGSQDSFARGQERPWLWKD